MDADWARLAERLKAARKLTGMSQGQMADAIGVGLSTIQKIERPTVTWAKVQPTHRAMARLVGWTEDSIQRVLDGGEPVLLPEGERPGPPAASTAAATSPALPSGMPQRVRRALSGGEAIDTELIPLDPDTPEGAGLVIVLKEGANRPLSDAKLEWAMRRWVKLTEIAREIYRQDPPPED